MNATNDGNETMRTLREAPDSVIDPASGAPRFGSYVGAVPHVDLRPMANPLQRIAREKRWTYVAIASEEVFVALAVVRLGYAATCFAYAFDAKSRAMLATHSVLGPAAFARVADGTGRGAIASFDFGGARAKIITKRAASTTCTRASARTSCSARASTRSARRRASRRSRPSAATRASRT